jgi:hypothetical protein
MRILFLLLSCASTFCLAKEKQQFQAQRIQDAPKIDGDLSDAVWNQEAAKIQFHQFATKNGSPSEFYSSGFNYTFNTKMSLRLRVRHNWTTLRYKQFFELAENGDLLETTYEGLNQDGNPAHNTNFNALNIDMVYFWQIAPGSFLNLVWKDAIASESADTGLRYFGNLESASRDPQVNSISLRITYFIDYLTLKKVLKGK